MYTNIVLMITILIFTRKHIQLRTTHFTHFFLPDFYGIYKEGAFMLRNCETVSILFLIVLPSYLPKNQNITQRLTTLHSHQQCAVWEVNMFPVFLNLSFAQVTGHVVSLMTFFLT